MNTIELIAALQKRGCAPSPIGCVAVLRLPEGAPWPERLATDPMIPAPQLGERYFYWPDHEWPADEEEDWYYEACQLVRDGRAP